MRYLVWRWRNEMLALLFRHGVELPIPGSTNASLEVAGPWHRSHPRALREPLGSSCTCPALAGPSQLLPSPCSWWGWWGQGSLSMMIHNQTHPGLKKELPQPAASWLGIRKKTVLSVWWGNGLLGTEPLCPLLQTQELGLFTPQGSVCSSEGSSGEGIRSLGLWAGAECVGSSADWFCQGGAPQTPDPAFDAVITAV